MDGFVILCGGDGFGVSVGGGSGGSILIEVMNFIGYGEINVMGGDGCGLSGFGGVGGRILVYVCFCYKYVGVFKVYGGDGKIYVVVGIVYIDEIVCGL